jgi:arsenate reductase (thioredoxin)
MAHALFVCLHNAGRSQMSQALFERAAAGRHQGGDECPYVPGVRYLDWDLPDPKGAPVDEVRATREEIARRVEALVAELDRG